MFSLIFLEKSGESTTLLTNTLRKQQRVHTTGCGGSTFPTTNAHRSISVFLGTGRSLWVTSLSARPDCCPDMLPLAPRHSCSRSLVSQKDPGLGVSLLGSLTEAMEHASSLRAASQSASSDFRKSLCYLFLDLLHAIQILQHGFHDLTKRFPLPPLWTLHTISGPNVHPSINPPFTKYLPWASNFLKTWAYTSDQER